MESRRASRGRQTRISDPSFDIRGNSFLSFGTERPSPRRGAPTGGTAEIEGVEVSTEHWIGGERVGSSDTFSDVSPIDEQVIAEVARGGQAEADRAVAAAR